jgi:hypothetical protein
MSVATTTTKRRPGAKKPVNEMLNETTEQLIHNIQKGWNFDNGGNTKLEGVVEFLKKYPKVLNVTTQDGQAFARDLTAFFDGKVTAKRDASKPRFAELNRRIQSDGSLRRN